MAFSIKIENLKKGFTFSDLYFYPNKPLRSAQTSEDWNIIVAQFVIMKTQSLFVRGKTLFLILETDFLDGIFYINVYKL